MVKKRLFISLLWAFCSQLAVANEQPGKPVNSNDISTGFMVNYNYRNFTQSSKDKLGDAGLALIRLGLESRHNNFVLSARYHWYNNFNAVHHAWLGYDINQTTQIQAGVIRVPFGLLPYAAHTFWLGVPYYLGHDDDHDVGLNLRYRKAAVDLQFALIKNEELGNAASAERYSADIVTDNTAQQHNEEVNQVNFRGSYTWHHDKSNKTELGLSTEWGQLYNTQQASFGDHWASALHMNGNYGKWQIQLQMFKYQYSPDNPASVSNKTVFIGMLGAKSEVASRGMVYVANIARKIFINIGPIKKLTCYNDFSVLDKSEVDFKDSKLNILGCLIKAGPAMAFVDIMSAKNMTFFGDNTGMGSGGNNQWRHRFNVRLGYFFH